MMISEWTRAATIC